MTSMDEKGRLERNTSAIDISVLGAAAAPLLSAEDVCRIVKTCGDSGVAELTFGGLSVRFGRTPEPCIQQDLPPSQPVISEAVLSEAVRVDKETLVRQELLQKEEMLQDLLISDPAAYERALMGGDLEGKDA